MHRTFDEKGALPLLLLVSIIAALAFFTIASTFPVKDSILNTLYPKNTNYAAESNQYVKVNGNQFMLEGKEFKFIGFNLFDAANTYFPEQNKRGYSCPRENGWWQDIYTEAKLDEELGYMKQQSGATVLRFWAYQQYTNGGTDWSGIDKVIRVAKKHNIKIIPVLDDGPGYCTQPNGQAKWAYNNDTWYTEGYKQKMGSYQLTYPEYVRAIVSRYKDEPTIFSWMMINEADTSRKNLADGSTKIDGDGPSVLVNFATEIGNIIKSIDQNHLVTLGTQSNGASGASGKDFLSVYGLSQLDYTEIHDWGYWADTNHDWRKGEQNALPGSSDNKTLPNPDSADCQKVYGAQVACSISMALKKLNKPVIMGEGGVSTNRWSKEQRAGLLEAKIKTFFDVGGAGYILWQWNRVIDSEGFDVQMNTNDPLLPKLKSISSQFIALNPSATPNMTITPTINPTPVPTNLPTIIPTQRPTNIPTIRPTAIPTVIPTIKPTANPTINPSPSAIPNGQSANTDQFIYSGSEAKVYNDINAKNGKGLLVMKNTTIKATVTGPSNILKVRVKADKCFGDPHINVKIDNRYAIDTNVTVTNFNDYSANIKWMNLGNRTHTIEVIYNNDYSFICDRNIKLESVTLQ